MPCAASCCSTGRSGQSPATRRVRPPQHFTPSDYTATVGQVRRLVDGLAAEMYLVWANEIAPDAVPSFEGWAYPERPR